ncbi:unnamed protein product [Arctogadus glacialis]
MIRGLWYREPLVPGASGTRSLWYQGASGTRRSLWYQELLVPQAPPGTRSLWYQEPLLPGSISTRLQQKVLCRGAPGVSWCLTCSTRPLRRWKCGITWASHTGPSAWSLIKPDLSGCEFRPVSAHQ